MKRNNVRGFSLVEVMIALLFLSLSIFAILELKRHSNLVTTNAYLGFLATQLAHEPIEVFRGFGYRWLEEYEKHPLEQYPIHQKHDLGSLANADEYPNQARDFERYIALTHEETPLPNGKIVKAFRVSVSVSPKKKSWAESWLTRSEITLESLIVEQPW